MGIYFTSQFNQQKLRKTVEKMCARGKFVEPGEEGGGEFVDFGCKI